MTQHSIYDRGDFHIGDRVKATADMAERTNEHGGGFVVGIDDGEPYPIRVWFDSFEKLAPGEERYGGYPFCASELEHTA